MSLATKHLTRRCSQAKAHPRGYEALGVYALGGAGLLLWRVSIVKSSLAFGQFFPALQFHCGGVGQSRYQLLVTLVQ
jgi:hypothetical protein